MKTFFKILLSIILFMLLSVSAYYGYRFYNFENPNIKTISDIRNKQKEINALEDEIIKAKKDIKKIIEENKEAYTELENWQRHQEKLEKILAQ